MIKHRLRRLETLLNHCELQVGRQRPPRPLQTVQDVIDLLQEQVEAIRAEPWSPTLDKARAIGYLAGIARKAIEVGTLAARIELLEAVLKQRKAGAQR
jgi:hypothetical protein